MADDPKNRLERHAEQSVPPIDPDFANRLESQLRVDHAAATTRRPWATRALVPRVLAVAALVVAGVAGIVAITADDAGVPVAVVDDESPAPLDAPTSDDALPVEVTPTPTPTGTPEQTPGIDESPIVPPALPTATVVASATVPTVEPADGATPIPPTSTSLPTLSTVPFPSVTAQPTAQPATPVPAAATAIPVPTATVVPEPTPSPTPQTRPTPTQPPPTVTPTPEHEPAPIELVCEARSAADAVGVVCSWDEPTTDRTMSQYEVMRSRNGGEVQVVARQRADSSTSYIDRNVESGDEVIYLVQALDADDQVVGASTRQVVRLR